MINAGFVDFVFTGSAIVPEVLFFAGYVGEALLLLVPMLIAACLISMYHQNHQKVGADALADEEEAAAGDHEPRQA